MPLPDMAQAESLNLLNYCRHDMCAGCGTESKAPGHLLGHKCRASLGLYDQASIFDEESDDWSRLCTVCGGPLRIGDHAYKQMHEHCIKAYRRASAKESTNRRRGIING